MPTAPKVALDVRVPTVVLKFGHYPLHHGGIGAIRSLGRTGVPVYGVHEDRFAPAARSRYLTGRFVWPTDGLDSDALLDGLVAIGDRIAGRAVLVPTDDEASVFIAEHADALRERFRFAEPPPALPRAVASKLSLYRICHELGVPCPQAVAPTTRADIHAFLSRARFPVVVKADEAWELLRSGVRSTQIVAHPEDVLRVWERVEREGRGALLLQEHISDGEDWIFHGYCNERSECLVGFTGVKLRSYPAYAGPTTLGRCRANARLHDQATSLVRELSYRGIMDMDWRLDRRDGQYKLLDFNPRVGAQFRLFETPAGVDVVRAQHLDLTGRPVPPGSPPEDRGFIVEPADALAALAYRRDGALTAHEWLASLRPPCEPAWLAGDDLLPVAFFAPRFILHGAGKAVVRVRPRRAKRPVLPARQPRYSPGARSRRASSE